MKVDRDDIPDYLKPRKKQGPWRTLAIMSIGSAIFWGLVTIFAKPIVIDVGQLKQAIRFGGEPIFSQQPAQPQQPPAEALQGNDQDWIRSSQAQQTIQANRELEEWSRQRTQETQERQTSFSDSNYVPTMPANVVPAIKAGSEMKQPQKKQEIVVIGQANNLKEFCPYKEGSLDQRHCKMQSDLWERNKNYNGR